jgi:hypothetical protein
MSVRVKRRRRPPNVLRGEFFSSDDLPRSYREVRIGEGLEVAVGVGSEDLCSAKTPFDRRGKLYAGNPHVRFDEGPLARAPCTAGWGLLHQTRRLILASFCMVSK